MLTLQHLREHVRTLIHAQIRYFVWNESFEAVATELGAGGVFVETQTPVSEGSLLTLRISLPDQRPFTVLGRVVRSIRGGWGQLRKTGMGIQFVDLGAPERGALTAFIEHQAGRPA